MENSDFRERLNNRKVPLNPDSWNQMEALLDHTGQQEKKNKKRFFFILLLLGSIGIAVLYFLFNNDSRNAVTEISTNEVRNDALQTLPISTKSDATIDPETTNKKTSIYNSGYDTYNSAEKERREVAENKSNTESTIANHDVVNYNIDGISNPDVIIKSLEVQKIISNKSTEKINNLNVDKNQEAVKTRSSNVTVNNLLQENDENTNGLKSIETKSTLNGRRLKGISLLPFGEHDIYSGTTVNKSSAIPSIKLSIEPYVASDSRNLFITIQGGPARFNSNPGYTIGVGLFKDINKLIGIGIESKYSYGAEQTVTTGDPFTNERQLDFNINGYLNLLRFRQHKIFFEIGVGYTFYNGERIIRSEPIMIDTRKNSGRNIAGGISYSYYLNNKHLFSIKGGVISYDDSVEYLSLGYGFMIK